MSKNRTRLSHADMMEIDAHCQLWINLLGHYASLGEMPNAQKCIATVLAELQTKVQRKKVGIIPKHGYTMRINEAEIAAILHMRNDRGWQGAGDNGIFRLLKFNNI